MTDPIRVPEHLRGAHEGARWIDAETGHKLIRVRENVWLDAEGTGCVTNACARLDAWWQLAVPPEPEPWEVAMAAQNGTVWGPLILFLAAVTVLAGTAANRARGPVVRFALAALGFAAPLAFHPLVAASAGVALAPVHLAAVGVACSVFALCWIPSTGRLACVRK